MKIPVYFRTRDQLDSLVEAVKQINDTIRKRVGWLDIVSWVQLTTKYTNKSPIYQNIPKRKPGDKKYIAVIHANKHKMQQYNIDLEEMVASLDGIEFVRRGDDGPKYKGETTETEFTVTTEEQFTELVRVFDAGFGHGNWRVKGPSRNLRQLIRRVEEARESNSSFMMSYIRNYENGVPLRITVNQENADLNKYLFKLRLRA